MTDAYDRRRQDELADSRFVTFESQLATMGLELKDIRDRMIKLEARISAAVILATALITIAAVFGPIFARIALPQQ